MAAIARPPVVLPNQASGRFRAQVPVLLPRVPTSAVATVLHAFQEHVGIMAHFIFKQELLRRRCLPSSLPLGHLAGLVDNLCAHLDTEEARERFRQATLPALREELNVRIETAAERAGSR